MRDYDTMLAVVFLTICVAGIWLYVAIVLHGVGKRLRRLEKLAVHQGAMGKPVPKATRSIMDVL